MRSMIRPPSRLPRTMPVTREFCTRAFTALAGSISNRTSDTLGPTVLPAPTALKMATVNGARVLGLEDQVGALIPDLKGDIMVIDLDQPHLTPIYDPYSHLVYAATGADVQTVLVHGRILVQDRRLTSFDLEETLARSRELASGLLAKKVNNLASRLG